MITVRKIEQKDKLKVRRLDRESRRHVERCMDEEDTVAFGVFDKRKLIAYMTVRRMEANNYVRELDERLDGPLLCLDNVYVNEKCRGKGYGVLMIKETIRGHKLPIILTPMTDSLIEYYEKLGFSHTGDHLMIKAL